VHPTNPDLARAVSALDAAFRTEFAKHASTPSQAVVRRAQHGVNAICPGAAS
jgi:hypothetical protein